MNTTDTEECLSVVSNHLGPHGFELSRRGSPFGACQSFVMLNQSAATYLTYNTQVRILSATIPNAYLVLAPMQGAFRLLTEGKEYHVSSNTGIVIHPDAEFSIQTEALTSALMFKIDQYEINRTAVQTMGYKVDQFVRFSQLFDRRSGGARSIFRTMRYIAQELNEYPETAENDLMKDGLEQLLIRLLLQTQLDQSCEERRVSSITPMSVRKVEAYINAHSDFELTSKDIIRVSGVSERSMYALFKKFRGISPMAYLRGVRMKKVRQDLLTDGTQTKVTDILVNRGILQFGRFAKEYQNIYGETPSQTLRRRKCSGLATGELIF